MINLYNEIIKNKQLYIVDEDDSRYTIPSCIRVAVVANLFYYDDLSLYLDYMYRIPEQIDVIIFSSNNNVLDELESKKRNNWYIYKKENRGRDVSALLVEFGKYYSNYDYFCFVHDKKANSEYLSEDVKFWISNLWDNLLGDELRLYNIIELLEKNKRLGYLSVPSPVGEVKKDWYSNTWYMNFDNTQELAKELGLICDLNPNIPPVSVGTAFWCKSKAIKKIFEYDWKYSDFQEEPLPLDGTISHAIERIFPYVVQDAGYTVGIILCRDYAEKLILKVQDLFFKCFDFCQKEYTVSNVHQLLSIPGERDVINRAFKEYNKVYIYGAGHFGSMLCKRMVKLGYTPTGYIVTEGFLKERCIEGIDVFELNEELLDDDTMVFIAVDNELQSYFVTNLNNMAFKNYYIVCNH